MDCLPVTRGTLKQELHSVNARIDATDSRVVILEDYSESCKSDHEAANAFRRKNDAEMIKISSTLEASLETNKEILNILKDYAPTVRRVQADHTTRDTVQKYAIWIAAVAAGGGGIHYWLNIFGG